MKINVGSKNQVKINAVSDTILLYKNIFKDPVIKGVDIQIEEYGHPKSIDEIYKGASSRAKASFKDCDYSIGLEGGLIAVPLCKSGYMEVSGCVIFDGKNEYFGISSGFEWPIKITKYILDNKGDASLGFKEFGYTTSNKQGAEKGGIIGVLTNNRITREDQIKQSIIMALIYLEKPELR